MNATIKKILTVLLVAILGVTTIGVFGCEKKSDMEKAADQMEESAEDAADEAADQMEDMGN
jgi:hypothetical protein